VALFNFMDPMAHCGKLEETESGSVPVHQSWTKADVIVDFADLQFKGNSRDQTLSKSVVFDG
jgi:hypothetical protein